MGSQPQAYSPAQSPPRHATIGNHSRSGGATRLEPAAEPSLLPTCHPPLVLPLPLAQRNVPPARLAPVPPMHTALYPASPSRPCRLPLAAPILSPLQLQAQSLIYHWPWRRLAELAFPSRHLTVPPRHHHHLSPGCAATCAPAVGAHQGAIVLRPETCARRHPAWRPRCGGRCRDAPARMLASAASW